MQTEWFWMMCTSSENARRPDQVKKIHCMWGRKEVTGITPIWDQNLSEWGGIGLYATGAHSPTSVHICRTVSMNVDRHTWYV
jgi:hypothetical protein